MKTITTTKAIELLIKLEPRTEIVLDSRTKVYGRKTPFGIIFKYVCAVVQVGGPMYEETVNQELVNRGLLPEFVSEPLRYGRWLVPGRIIQHTNGYYLRTQTTKDLRIRFPVKILGYESQFGRELTPAQVKPFLPQAPNAGTQFEVGLEETRDQVWVRNYDIGNIRSITIQNEQYVIRN